MPEEVLTRLDGLVLEYCCVKIISCSKGGEEPFLSMLEHKGSVAMYPTEEILPQFLKKVGARENLVLRGKNRDVENINNFGFHGSLCLDKQQRRSGPNVAENCLKFVVVGIKWDSSTRASDMRCFLCSRNGKR